MEETTLIGVQIDYHDGHSPRYQMTSEEARRLLDDFTAYYHKTSFAAKPGGPYKGFDSRQWPLHFVDFTQVKGMSPIWDNELI
jgi:hypothetical protein